MKKTMVLLAAIIVAVIGLTSCASGMGCGGNVSEIAKPQPGEGAQVFTVEGSCEAVLQGGTLTVSGTTNLMDGVNGVIKVMGSDGSTVEEVNFTKQGEAITHTFTVEEDWPDKVYGFVSFDTQQSKQQPKDVRELYGSKFENLEGESILWDSKGVMVVFQSAEVEIG